MSSMQALENKRLLCYKPDDWSDELEHCPWPAVWDPDDFRVYGQTIVLLAPKGKRTRATVNGWPVSGAMLVVEPGDLVRLHNDSTNQGDNREAVLCIGRALTGKRIRATGDEPLVDAFTGLPVDEGVDAFRCSRCGAVYAPPTMSHLNGHCVSCGHYLTFADFEDQPDCIEDGWL